MVPTWEGISFQNRLRISDSTLLAGYLAAGRLGGKKLEISLYWMGGIIGLFLLVLGAGFGVRACLGVSRVLDRLRSNMFLACAARRSFLERLVGAIQVVPWQNVIGDAQGMVFE
jgi:hypothetical protein